MRTKTRQRRSETRHLADPRRAGFAFIELLLVVALVSVVSALALGGITRHRTEAKQQEVAISSMFSKEAGEWRVLEIGEGGSTLVGKI